MHESLALVIAGPLNASDASPTFSNSSVANEDYGRCRDHHEYMSPRMDRTELKSRGGVEVSIY